MKLLLTSAGLTNPTIIDALLSLTNRPLTELHLAFVPTAANVERGDKYWLINDLNNCQNAGFKSVDMVDFTAVPKDIWLPRLQEADVLLFGGGNTFHLIYSLKQSGLDKELDELLKTRVYIGVSAGSMVAAKNIELSDSPMLYSEDIGEVAITHGLGYVDFQMRPHLNSKDFPNATVENLKEIAKNMTDTVYAIDDNTAIKVDGDDMTVVSEGTWEKFN